MASTLTYKLQVARGDKENHASLFSLPPISVGVIDDVKRVAFHERQIFVGRTLIGIHRFCFDSWK